MNVTFRPEAPERGATELVFDGTVRFERGRVVLITQDAGRLRAR